MRSILILIFIHLVLGEKTVITGKINYQQQVPAPDVGPYYPTGTILGMFLINQDNLQFEVMVNNLTGVATGLSVCLGALKEEGVCVKNLTFGQIPNANQWTSGLQKWTSQDTQTPLTDTLYETMKAGGMYIVWDTRLNPRGEARGQIIVLD